MSFDYLLDKIAEAKYETAPFRHIYIKNFFDDSHFNEIVSSPEITLKKADSDDQIFENLFDSNYKIISFPGCITNKDTYVKWHKERKVDSNHTNSACEGFGITLRLTKPTTPLISELFDFMLTDKFQETLASKFDVPRSEVFYDSGIQKYLDGYEISPHPDIRAKALTYMININPGADSESRDHHTHYLRFTDKFKFVQNHWDAHPEDDRFWVPWDWCETVKLQRENNSIVIFSPDNDTMHGVKAQYNHLTYQRTQLYGNLWYRDRKCERQPSWEEFSSGEYRKQVTVKESLKNAVPDGVKKFIKKNLLSNKEVIADRLQK